mmetsp:Transcript_8506/g.12696  ORF Transcript_8506/g.12696 Transcript_8506/m.12696 type:complete len:852 (-) Transcript_8506:111-2666(-)|eukprot:CAMPEP_0185036810 /NCGR_PEP_ID=MMETSP1103-20130426/30318_1 /TAXON_ID=36769 /ORGANISM="Paraphysomonas bandaiensis, Strain Caron Lab Isolate" /LENGTH=851 /DNA_ID=CAMNT_0027574501 /DNA_START=196 /DNA_END=2751 /DNA_ORIENTATION=+
MDFSSPDKWRKVKVIGRGGSSTVYEVEIIGTDLVVAAKEIQIDGLTKDQVLAIEAEIETMKTLQHQNIVNYLGTQRQENYFYIFLEYADKGSLRQFYQNRSALSEDQAALCTFHILSGLSYLHSNGIAHRDIKGANVLLTQKGEPKLADFGASKRYDTASIVSGLKGTPHWMAPEVIKGTQMTTGWMKADVWSLGCTVVEMLTGALPYAEFDNPMTAMYHIANGMSPPLKDVPVSDQAKDFVAACTTVDPCERPSVDELLRHPFLASCSAGQLLSLESGGETSDVREDQDDESLPPSPPPEEANKSGDDDIGTLGRTFIDTQISPCEVLEAVAPDENNIDIQEVHGLPIQTKPETSAQSKTIIIENKGNPSQTVQSQPKTSAPGDSAISINTGDDLSQMGSSSLELLQAQSTPQMHKTRKTRNNQAAGGVCDRARVDTSGHNAKKQQPKLPPSISKGTTTQQTQQHSTQSPASPRDRKPPVKQSSVRLRNQGSENSVQDMGVEDRSSEVFNDGNVSNAILAGSPAPTASPALSAVTPVPRSGMTDGEIGTLVDSLQKKLSDLTTHGETMLQDQQNHRRQQDDKDDCKEIEGNIRKKNERTIRFESHTAPNRESSSLITDSGDEGEYAEERNEECKLDEFDGTETDSTNRTVSTSLRPIAPLSSQKLSLCTESSGSSLLSTQKGKGKQGPVLVKKDVYSVPLKQANLSHNHHALHPHDKHQLNSKPLKSLRKKTNLRSKSANIAGGGSSVVLPPMERQPSALRALKNPMIPQLQLRVIQSAPSVSRSLNLPPIMSSKTPNKLQSTSHSTHNKLKHGNTAFSSPSPLGMVLSQGLTGVCKDEEEGGILAPRKG